MVHLAKQSKAQIMYLLMIKSLLSDELKRKGIKAVKDYFRYNSDMFKGKEKKIKCMFSHSPGFVPIFDLIPVK